MSIRKMTPLPKYIGKRTGQQPLALLSGGGDYGKVMGAKST